MIVFLALAALLAPEPRDPHFEGDWWVSDNIDNVTGEREVDAFQSLINSQNYVTLRLRCSKGRPTFFLEWEDVPFPAQTVVTFSAAPNGVGPPPQTKFILEKSNDPIERGLRATPETTEQIIKAIGSATYLLITAHLSHRDRSVGLEVSGTQAVWQRVSRHCPIRRVPTLPQ